MGREVNGACELSCDEAVMKSLDTGEWKAYGDTLLNAMGTGGNYKDSISSVTLNKSKKLLKERLNAIIKFSNPSKLTKFITAFLTFVFCIGTTLSGVYTFTPSSSSEQENTRINGTDYITAEQADEMALALTNKIWVWGCAEFFIPYMSEDGINQIIPASKSSEWAGTLNTNSTDAKALEIMQNTGNWGYIEPFLPQMTNAGIDAVVNCYNSKHFNPNEYEKASDYYN